MKRKGMQEELRMKNYELRWGKSPPRSKVLAQCAAVFSATPSSGDTPQRPDKSGQVVLSILGREVPLKKTRRLYICFTHPANPE